jgi:hypothetical protein
MSAPQTDPEKQKEKHKAPLLGMGATVIWAGVLLVLLVVFLVFRGNEPADGVPVDEEGSEVTVDE